MKRTRRQALGQHFLSNRRVLEKILRIIDPEPRDTIIEIGAGKGILTYALAQKAGKVVAVEKDRTLLPYLDVKEFSNLTVINRDILAVDFDSILTGPEAKVVGNLPYSISTPVLFKVLAAKNLFSRCVFLIQKEVAERICATPGSKKYAPLSILFENSFERRVDLRVSPESFSPPPRVDSAVISLTKRSSPLFPLKNEEQFSSFLRGAFRHRRKTLLNNLKAMSIPAEQAVRALSAQGLSMNIRPEQIGLETFVSLYGDLLPGKDRSSVGRPSF